MAKETDKTNTVYNWDEVVCPDFKGRKVFILPGAWRAPTIALFKNCGFEPSDNLDNAELVVFLGGADVDPGMYGEDILQKTGPCDISRDLREKQVYDKCVAEGIPMMGICRGAQFLHVMNGGKLWQHVDNHAGKEHFILDLEEGCRVKANSYHHQMISMVDSDKINMSVVAVTEDDVANTFEGEKILHLKEFSKGLDTWPTEVEAAIYHDTGCFVVQGHPEVGSPEYQSWTMCTLFAHLEDWDGVDEGPAEEEVEAEEGVTE